MIRSWLYGAYCVLVMVVGLLIIEAILVYYGLRKVFFGIPVNGEWGEFDQSCYRRDAHGKMIRKGPNGWN